MEAAYQRRHENPCSQPAGEQQPVQRNPNGLYVLEPSYLAVIHL
jgi:hypothetical protein